MAVDLKPGFLFDMVTGETVKLLDNTGPYHATLNSGGYGFPNVSATAVTATRYILSSYLQEQQASTSTDIVSSVEYTVTGASLTWDTKTYTAGTTFISMLSGTPTLGNAVLTATGRYSPVLDFLPTQISTAALPPSEFGIDSTIFPDSVYSAQYEIYTTSYSAQVGIPAGTYLVHGTLGQTVTISGVTYRINEVFTKGTSFTMTGSGSIALFNAQTVDANSNASPHYFQLSYYAFQAIKTLCNEIATSQCGCQEKLSVTLRLCETKYQAVLSNFETNLGLDISGTQSLLDQIASLAANRCQC